MTSDNETYCGLDSSKLELIEQEYERVISSTDLLNKLKEGVQAKDPSFAEELGRLMANGDWCINTLNRLNFRRFMRECMENTQSVKDLITKIAKLC